MRSPHSRLLGALAVAVLTASACSSIDGSDEPATTDRPADAGTVVPPDDIGVGGGVPVDNLEPGVADQEYETSGDIGG